MNTDKKKREDKSLKDSPVTQITSPVQQRSGDKLRENPNNDEETIPQDSRKSDSQQPEQSPPLRRHEPEQKQVTNEDDQKEIVNPTGEQWDE